MTGRPTKIDAIVGHRDNPTGGDPIPITVADRIVTGIQIGMYMEPAIAQAGVAKGTVYGWLHNAGLARIRTLGNDDHPSLTDLERKSIAFSDAVDIANATWEASKLGALEQLERGGTINEIVTEKIGVDADGEEHVIERTIRRETMLPDARVIMWRLTRRFPDRYHTRMELTGPDGGPLALTIEDRAAALSDTLERHLELDAPDDDLLPRRNGQG